MTLSSLVTPLRGFLVAITGAGLAWLAFNDLWWLAVVLAVLAITLGSGLDAAGRRILVSRPTRGLALLEWWILVPAMSGAVAGALVIVLTVALATPDGTDGDVKELVAAVSAAVTSFLTASFVDWSSDDKDSTLSERVKESFQERFDQPPADAQRDPAVHYFKPDSPGLRWVYSEEFKGVEGWGPSARKKRASGIETELASGASDA